MSGKDAEQNTESTPAPEKKGKRLGVVLAGALAVLALQVGAGIAVMRMMAPPPAAEEGGKKHKKEEAGHGTIFETGITKTISVAGSQGKHYLKVTGYIEYDAEKYPEMNKELEHQLTRIQYVVNRTLSTKPFEVVSDPAAQERISAEIVKELNKTLPHDKAQVQNLLFTDWILQ